MADIWSDAVGDWSTDSDIWAGVIGDCNLGVLSGLACVPQGEASVSMALGVSASKSSLAAAQSPVSIAVGAQVNAQLALEVQAAPLVSFGVSQNLTTSVEAQASPSGENDDWSQSGSWEDPGGGPWDQGVRMHMLAGMLPGTGTNIQETVGFGSSLDLSLGGEATAEVSSDFAALLNQVLAVEAQASEVILLTAQGDFIILASRDAVGSVTFGSVADLSSENVLEVLEAVGFDAAVRMELLDDFRHLWLDEAGIAGAWSTQAPGAATWSKDSTPSPNWTKADEKADNWTEGSSIDEEWT